MEQIKKTKEFSYVGKCAICKRDYTNGGNNPFPFIKDGHSRCCDYCNSKYVLPARENASIFQHYLEKAEAGDTEAQVMLGKLYNLGYGVEANEDLAIEWWAKAAKNGNKEAQAICDEWRSSLAEDEEE